MGNIQRKKKFQCHFSNSGLDHIPELHLHHKYVWPLILLHDFQPTNRCLIRVFQHFHKNLKSLRNFDSWFLTKFRLTKVSIFDDICLKFRLIKILSIFEAKLFTDFTENYTFVTNLEISFSGTNFWNFCFFSNIYISNIKISN